MKYNIWKDCRRVPLPELLDFIVDNRGKTVPTVNQNEACNVVLIATNCIRNENLYPVYEKIRFISEDTYKTWFRSHPIPGDIIFVNKGTPGRVCLCPDIIDFCIAQDMMAFRVDSNKLYNKYLLAVLRSRVMQEQIRITSVGDTIPHFKKEFLKDLFIPVPPMEIQRIIGDYYYKLSQIVELNKKINENLFEQLLALYKQMLIDSKIVKKLNLAELCDFQEGYVNPAQTHPEYFDGEVKWLRAVDINESFIINTSRTLTKTGFESAKKSALLFEPNTIVISKSGTIGRLGIIADYMCGNRAVINIRPKSKEHLPLIYCYLKSKQSEFDDLAVGSVQKNLYTSLLEPLIIPCPSDNEVVVFCSTANVMFSRIKNNCIENNNLIALRDTLLPKLMSGEIDVSEVKI